MDPLDQRLQNALNKHKEYQKAAPMRHESSDSEEEQKSRNDRDKRSAAKKHKFDYSFSSSSSDNEERGEASEKMQRQSVMQGDDSDDSVEEDQPRSMPLKTFGLHASPIAEETESQLSTNREHRDFYDM